MMSVGFGKVKVGLSQTNNERIRRGSSQYVGHSAVDDVLWPTKAALQSECSLHCLYSSLF